MQSHIKVWIIITVLAGFSFDGIEENDDLISKSQRKDIATASPNQDIKNVVVILADDHALKVTGCYGNEIIKTPSIDKLSESGIMFTKAYCNSPICSASRQSLLTGKYPHATGVNLLFTPFPDETNVTVAEHLLEYGYRTAIIGKEHWNNAFWYSLYKDGLPNHGFEQRIGYKQYKAFLEENPMPEIPSNIETYKRKHDHGSVAEWMNYRGLPQPVYDEYSEGTFYAKAAEKFIKENKDNPFFLWLAFMEPHHPYYFPIEYKDKYNPDDMPLPKGSPEDDRWVPAKFKNLTEDERRGIIASYYTSTEYLDKNIGLVLESLKSNNLDENTLVIYISDNGYLLNDHKRFEKHTMWEEAVHQPMIFRMPGIKGNITNSSLIEYVDVVPTILELIGKPALNESQGKSFGSLISGESQAHRDYVFSEYLQDNMAMVATKEWKYIFHTGSRDLGIGYYTGNGPSGIFHGLYNLKQDKSESQNLAYFPENKSTLEEMQEVMLQHFFETHPDAESCPQNLTTEGKLVWFCEPRDVGAIQNIKDVPDVIFKAK